MTRFLLEPLKIYANVVWTMKRSSPLSKNNLASNALASTLKKLGMIASFIGTLIAVIRKLILRLGELPKVDER